MNSKTMIHNIARTAIAAALALVSTTAAAETVTLSVDGDIAEGTAGHYYVNMPATGTNTLTLADASVTTFMVYDDGGKDGKYSNECNGFLVINAPGGYYLQLSGNIADCSNAGMMIWDGSNADIENPGNILVNSANPQNFNVNCENSSVVFYFFTNSSGAKDGFAVTVTLVDAPEHDINLNSASSGSAAATIGGTVVTKAREGETVTVTGTPDGGYLLSDVSVKDANNNDVAVTLSPWTNSATFTMPTCDVTITPTFAASDGFFITMPVTGTKRLYPVGVTSFKVYDDGGPNGNYSPNCNGWLEIVLPDGYHISFSGSVTTDATSGDRLGFYKWNSTNPTEWPKSDNAGEPFNFTYNFDESMRLQFKSNSANHYAGLDLTVTLVAASHAVTVNDGGGAGGSITASVGGESATTATVGQTVTLTAAPAAGYVLGSLSVRDADGNIVDVTGDMLWYAGANSASFTMPNSAVTVNAVFTSTMTAAGGLTVNMPKELAKPVTIPSGVTSFKVYDYGGADANYLGAQSQNLYLTAPSGCVLQLEGTVTTKSGGATTFCVYDGAGDETDDYLVNHVCSATDGATDGAAVTIPAVASTGESIYLSFNTDAADTYASLDLTVTVISPGEAFAVSVSNADATLGTMTASTATATLGTTVTLTATPATGCLLSDLSVTCGGRAVKTDWNVWTNSATFRMPNGAVTVTPTFTSDLSSLAVCLPVMGNKSVTIPEGVASFKIYDDGGASGDYTPYCNGGLLMTAAEGSQLRFTGSVTGPTDKFNMKIGENIITNTNTNINITTSGDEPDFRLFSNVSDTGAGLDVTATLLYAVGVATGISNGSVTASPANAAAGETVTLAVAPATDCTIGSVTVDGATLAADANGYHFIMPARRVTVGATFRKLLTHADIAIADIPAQQYDGTALTPAVTVTDGGTPLTAGTDYTVSPASATDAGDYTVTLTGIGQYDGTATRTFTISRRAVTLTSASDAKTYDGTALTNSGVTVGGDGFATGEGATYTVTGQQTNAGGSENTFSYALADGTKAENYDITTVNGTLTVTALTGVTVTITGHTANATYDGTEHTASGYDVEISNPLYSEACFTFSGTAEATRTDAGTTGMGLDASHFTNMNTNFDGVTFSVTDGSITVNYYAAALADNGNNAEAISNIITNYGGKADVTLQGRTLFKDGKWNTLCLPFALSAEQIAAHADFAEATLMELDTDGKNGFDTTDGTLYLTFMPATAIAAGVPYLVKWDAAGDNFTSPTFSGVTIGATAAATATGTSDGLEEVQMVGCFSPVPVVADDKSILFLGDANTLYYSTIDRDIRACRAYFSVPYIKEHAGAKARAFRLDFGDGEANGITTTEITDGTDHDAAWYTLDGRKLSGKPAAKGIYVSNGRKIAIK